MALDSINQGCYVKVLQGGDSVTKTKVRTHQAPNNPRQYNSSVDNILLEQIGRFGG
jgi:hypothetical protein